MPDKWALFLTATLPFGVSTTPTFEARGLLTPQVILDYATYQGVGNPLQGVNSFLGMPENIKCSFKRWPALPSP